ncbi:MAG TPA: prolyl oligopeptidase family serine peptidase, partial [Acidobacteriota bacterium]|nr:prolyl oligopeptidase family serine peptidase [Acidobacteriota bacterium]
PIGEAPRFGGSLRTGFSADSKWAAFLAYPGSKEAKALRKERKRVTTTAVLVDLAKGEKTEFEKVRAVAFSGDDPAFVAMHRYAPESQEKEKDKWTGSDLVVRELATGKEVNIGNVAEFAFDKAGAKLAILIDAQGQAANGLQLRDMASGAVLALEDDKAAYKSLAWTEKGEALSFLKGKEDKAYEDKLWSVVGFSGFRDPKGPRKVLYDPAADKTFPEGLTVSPDRIPAWTESFDALLFGIHEVQKKKDADKKDGPAGGPGAGPAAGPGAEADEDVPDLVIWHGQDKRLQSEQQVQEQRDKTFSYLAEYRVAEKKFIRLADDDLRDVSPAPKDRFAVGEDIRAYELDSNLDGRNFSDVYVIDMKTGKRTLALTKCRYYFMPLYDGGHFLYYEDGHFFTFDMATGRSVNITKDVPASFVNEDDDHNVVNPPDYPVGSTKDGRNVLLSDGWDIWSVPVSGAGQAVNLTGNGAKDRLRYRRLRIDLEEKAVDLAAPQYFSVYGEWTKKAGLARLDKGQTAPTRLLWDDAGFGGLAKAKKADVFVYTRDTFKDYPDFYATDATLANGRRLTEANPQQKDFLWSSGSVLLDYKMDPKSGLDKSLQAALFLPANYENGKRYPTIVYYYEKMSQQLNRYAQPSANGFNKSVYTSNGYAVLMPDITYKINDPGMSAVWCVLPALDAAVAAGVVDRAKVGLQGHSWGGYQTAFLITQAEFAAAVAGAPLTNMISMYSSIYFNSGSANQPIFESSQGRFKGGYWDNLEAYQRNSPVYYAAQVETPLIILHNDKDGAVVWNQGIEYYNTLRRLKKPVLMLQYVGENHGLQKPANQKDYTVRMKEFFDHYLMGKPAPSWYTDGVPYLKLKDHLRERAKDLKPAEKPAEKPDKKEPEKK